jgi:hypothetical protein
MLASRSSRADVVSTYFGSECKGERPMDQAALLWQQLNGQWGLTNTGTSDPVYGPSANIHCPITKNTSNTGITNDQLNSVSVTFNNGGDGSSTCRVNVWQMGTSSAFNMGPALKDHQLNTTISQGTFNVYTKNAASFGGYWGTSTQWAYAELVCQLRVGASIASYTVDEVGSATGTLIFPASEGGVSGGFTFGDETLNPDDLGKPGFLESLESLGTFFNYGGMMFPNSNSTIRIMAGPPVAPNIDFTCTFENTPQTVPHNPGGASFPGKVLTFTRTDRNQDAFTCIEAFNTDGTHTASGDAMVFSYKMF